jgi:hypothetical protein
VIALVAVVCGLVLVYQIRTALADARQIHDARPCRECEALRERLRKAKAERNRYRLWARAIGVTQYPGWEQAAGTMSRWSEAVDTDPKSTP